MLFLVGLIMLVPATSRAVDGEVLDAIEVQGGTAMNQFSDLEAIGDVDGDGVVDIATSDYILDEGEVRIRFMNANGSIKGEQLIAEGVGGLQANLALSGEFGFTVVALGDVDGDDVPDIAVSEVRGSSGGSRTGAIYILFLNDDGTVKAEQKIADNTGGFPDLLQENSFFGSEMAAPGDIDGDGIVDLVASASIAGSNNGFYTIFLNIDGTVKDFQRVDTLVGGFEGDFEAIEYVGYLEGIGDLDGDGTVDVVMGVTVNNDGADGEEDQRTGHIWVLFMNTDGTVREENRIEPNEEDFGIFIDFYDGFGNVVVNAGDLNGDGTNDLAVGLPSHLEAGQYGGTILIIFLNEDGTVKASYPIHGHEGSLEGLFDDESLIGSKETTALGDFNEDGLNDLMTMAVVGGNRELFILYLDGSIAQAGGGSGNDSATYPENITFTASTTQSCTLPATVRLQAGAQNAVKVVLANNSEFLNAQTYPLLGSSALQVNMSVDQFGSSTFYAFFESSTANRSGVFSQTVNVLQNCDADEEEEDQQNDQPEDALDLPETAPSPVNGQVQEVSQVRKNTLIRGSSYAAVYYIDEAGTRRPFLNETLFFTYFDSFEDVQTVTDATLSVVPLGSPMLPKSGVVLVKLQSDPKVYMIENHPSDTTKAVRRHVPSEQVAEAVFGSDWSEYVIDIDATLYPRFEEGAPIAIDEEVNKTIMKKRSELGE